MIVVAVASGTSADALDTVAVELDWTGDAAGSVELRVLGVAERAWPGGLGERLLALLPPATTTAAEVCALDTEVGQAVGAAARLAVDELAGGHADLVVSPGQTVHHEVDGDRCLGTLQLGQPAWVAEATGLPVVSDLRVRDVAAGGHGAPLASTLDAYWLAPDDGRARAALNLGGIANLTVVAPDGVRAWDTGPACCLLDVAVRRISKGAVGYDRDGRLAADGTVRTDLLDRLLATPYLALPPPKSTGRETFSAALLDAALAGLPEVGGPDLLATLVALTARTVAADVPTGVVEVVASGGGVHHPGLMAALADALAGTGDGTVDGAQAGPALTTSAAHGLDPDAKEACMWALLGFLTWHGLPGTVSGATTATAPRVLGRLTPGRDPLRLPAPAAPLRRLRVVGADSAGATA